MPGRIIITGGKGALGQAIADEFAKASWAVDSPGRSELDVSCPQSVASYFLGREVDLLVCAAGITRDAPLLTLSEQNWDEVCQTNLSGSARCAKAVAAGMLRRRKGHIVLISSYSALHPPIGQAAYAASKAGLIGLGLSLARELGPAGIRSNIVLPGFLATKMTEGLSAERQRAVLEAHLLGGFNTPDRVARFVRFLEEDLPQTSGQVFSLDSRVA